MQGTREGELWRKIILGEWKTVYDSSREKERLYLPPAWVPKYILHINHFTLEYIYFVFYKITTVLKSVMKIEVLTFLFPKVMTFSCLYASLLNIVHEQAKFLADTQTG